MTDFQSAASVPFKNIPFLFQLSVLGEKKERKQHSEVDQIRMQMNKLVRNLLFETSSSLLLAFMSQTN